MRFVLPITLLMLLLWLVPIVLAANYPSPFITNGNADVAIVTGANAPIINTIASTDVAASLQQECAKQNTGCEVGGVGFLDWQEDSFRSRSLIIVGSPCQNKLSAKLLDSNIPVCDSEVTSKTGISDGQFLIQAFVSPYNPNKIALLVMGYSDSDTRKATTYLTTAKPSLGVGTILAKTSSNYADVLGAGYLKSSQQQVCVDTDGGKDYYVKGTVVSGIGSALLTSEDQCCRKSNSNLTTECGGIMSGNYLDEGICDSNNDPVFTSYECPNGCFNGACVRSSPTSCPSLCPEGTTPLIDWSRCVNGTRERAVYECSSFTTYRCVEKNETEPCSDEIRPDQTVPIVSNTSCDGCLYQGKCIAFGIRAAGNYCDMSGVMQAEKEGNAPCENNFECLGNVCVNNSCIDQGFIQRLLNWLKKLFGVR